MKKLKSLMTGVAKKLLSYVLGTTPPIYSETIPSELTEQEKLIANETHIDEEFKNSGIHVCGNKITGYVIRINQYRFRATYDDPNKAIRELERPDAEMIREICVVSNLVYDEQKEIQRVAEQKKYNEKRDKEQETINELLLKL